MYDLPIPEEPADRSVVLDRDAEAWQRRGDVWARAGVTLSLGPSRDVKAWAALLVDRGPLALMIAESALDEYLAERPADGWRDVGYTGPDARHYAQGDQAPSSPMTDEQRDSALEGAGQGFDLRPTDARLDDLKDRAREEGRPTEGLAAGACASTWGAPTESFRPQPGPRAVRDDPQA